MLQRVCAVSLYILLLVAVALTGSVATQPERVGGVCLHFFYMGLNHYIGSLLNYRLLSPSVIMLFLRLCCVQECGFRLVFLGRCACYAIYGSVLSEIHLTL